jgi:SAM-dependent methyltransferase
MALLYGPHYERIWTDALLLPGHDDLLTSLATEVAEHYGEPVDDARERMRAAFEERGRLMAEQFPSASADPAELVAYYSDRRGVYTSAYWHSLRADRYALHAVSALHAVQSHAPGPRVFEFGHGVGSAAILFAQHGFDVGAGDISTSYRDFAQVRLDRRGLGVELVALEQDDPPSAAFDAVVSFDVLEHIPQPLEALARMRDRLVPGGVVVMNVAVGRDPNNPEHLIHRHLGFDDRIRGLGFERVPHPSLFVLYRRAHGGARRALYRLQDSLVAARDDVVLRAPTAGALLQARRSPPL